MANIPLILLGERDRQTAIRSPEFRSFGFPTTTFQAGGSGGLLGSSTSPFTASGQPKVPLILQGAGPRDAPTRVTFADRIGRWFSDALSSTTKQAQTFGKGIIESAQQAAQDALSKAVGVGAKARDSINQAANDATGSIIDKIKDLFSGAFAPFRAAGRKLSFTFWVFVAISVVIVLALIFTRRR